MANQYHLKISTIVKEDPRNVALEFNSNRPPEYEIVETEIRCIGAKALARHLRAIAEELDPPTPKTSLHPPGYRTTNAITKHITPVRDNPQA